MNGDFWISILVCLALVGVSTWLIRRHFHAWREFLALGDADPREFEYRRRQCGRRVQSSAMIGLIGLLILVGYFVRPPVPVVLGLFFWLGVILLVGWVGLLAVVDMFATRLFYSNAQQVHEVEHVQLKAALRRAQGAEGNGKTEGRLPDDAD